MEIDNGHHHDCDGVDDIVHHDVNNNNNNDDREEEVEQVRDARGVAGAMEVLESVHSVRLLWNHCMYSSTLIMLNVPNSNIYYYVVQPL